MTLIPLRPAPGAGPLSRESGTSPQARGNDTAPRELHISRRARELYHFDRHLFSLRGNVIFADFYAVRVFARRMNERRDLLRFPERVVQAGQINAMGLIDEILHYVIQLFREENNRSVLSEAAGWLEARLGRQAVDEALARFVDEFPPVAVYQEGTKAEQYLQGESEGIPHRLVALEEMILLWLSNLNPAFHPHLELFDDEGLERQSAYRTMMEALHEFFATQAPFGPDEQNLVDMLRSPALAHPHSLTEQLEYIRRRWGPLLGKYLYRLLSSLDLIREEQKLAFLGPGPALVYEYRGLEHEAEAFSPDRDWMPRVVMIAKNAYVWLDQLSKLYRRPIGSLDQVPDEELERLQRGGFTSLWLIGLWERSRASQRIKQMCGNPEAVASAYSLLGYDIAADLGGWEAFNRLKDRAWQRGIRMAGDMVPNHMGIDSHWVMEHPDWFVGLDYSPFPSYSFGGANLSWNDGVGLYLEDHYYSRSDAAVVFRRVDHATGGERYIYHGNDGTSMPWNDTAQLDFLKAEVREAVIQTILHVARSFPVIRFDAAMTLTKKHYQRLWYPEPGTGGDIPSRADHGLTRSDFDRAMPAEFWREVVDRVAREVPDTLLLAEAFWLLEGYFVRTLGMHRVYNSAFMNMLKSEHNAEYRSVIKNTLEFNPEILKRFVNFMNNPDEETAVAQFGKGDKYFGVCTLMITLPGLPMFGHGQIEGYTEKYGMEFRRAYWDEWPDEELGRRHERQIFPLVHRRALFAEVENFLLYDLMTPEGAVNEDVFAYSNRTGNGAAGGEAGLVVYHNRYADTRGWVRASTAVSVRSGRGEERTLLRRSLAEGLGLPEGPQEYCLFRDAVSGLEYLRRCQELRNQGLYVELGAYRLHVFMDFRIVADSPAEPYATLADYLDGRGVPNMAEALREVVLQPLHGPVKALLNPRRFELLLAPARTGAPLLEETEQRTLELLEALRGRPEAGGQAGQVTRVPQGTGPRGEGPEAPSAGEGIHGRGLVDAGATPVVLASRIRRSLEACLELGLADRRGALALLGQRQARGLDRELEPLASDRTYGLGALLAWVFVRELGAIVTPEDAPQRSRSWIDEWLLGKLIAGVLQELGLEEGRAWRAVALVKVLTEHQRWFESAEGRLDSPYRVLERLLADTEVQQFLHVHRHEGILWFNQESFGELLRGLLAVAVIDALAAGAGAGGGAGGASAGASSQAAARQILERYELVRRLRAAERQSGYQLEGLLSSAESAAAPRPPG